MLLWAEGGGSMQKYSLLQGGQVARQPMKQQQWRRRGVVVSIDRCGSGGRRALFNRGRKSVANCGEKAPT
jgi:hypothetical protein